MPPTAVKPSRKLPIIFFATIVIDIALPSILGLVDADGTFPPPDIAAFFYNQTHPYLFGASAIDLWAVALLRVVGYFVLTLSRFGRLSRPPPTASSGQLLREGRASPLLANAAINSESALPAPEPVTPSLPTALCLRASTAGWCAWVLTVISWLHCIAKGFGRLLQSGTLGDGDGFGQLPLSGTTPPEIEFWICITAVLACSEAERRMFVALSKRRSDPKKRNVVGSSSSSDPDAEASGAGGGTSGGSGGGSMNGSDNRSAADKEKDAAADAAKEAKESYLKRSEPSNVRAIATVFRMMCPDWYLLLLAYTGLCMAALGESLVPLLYGQVIDAIVITPDMARFRLYLLYLVLTAAGTGIFTGLRGSTFILLGGRFGRRLRVKLFEALLKQELDFFGATKTGDVTSRLSADCQKVSDQVQLNVNVFLRSVIQVFFTLAFMVYINLRLALACFVVVPAIAMITEIFSRYMRVFSRKTQAALADANGFATEVLAAIPTMRAFAAEREELQRFTIGMDTYVDTVWRQCQVYFVYSSLSFTFLPYLTYCIILFFAAQLIHYPEGCVQAQAQACPMPPLPPLAPPPLPPNSPPPLIPGGGDDGPPVCSLSGANLISFVFYMNALFSAFQSLGNIWTSIAEAIGAADVVCKWLQRTPTILPPTSSTALTPSRADSCRGDLKLTNVTFRYQLRPERTVLSKLNLHVKPAEVVALCGPSGGGKSSIIALLERFYVPEVGTVLLDDVPIGQLSPEYFHQKVAIVSQEPTLFARSLHDNICYGLLDGRKGKTSPDEPPKEEVIRAASLANAHDFISAFPHGYETHVGEQGQQLSGGQKQRVAIARALVRRPVVLLLDEATSALDAESEHIVQSAIDSMIEQSSMTVLLVAHRLSTVRNADRICVIKGGGVAESGTHSELLARPDGEYAKLVQRQMQQGGDSGSASGQPTPVVGRRGSVKGAGASD